MSVWASARMVGHCQQQAGYRHPMPLLHQQPSVPTQLPVDYGPSCGSLLGHSQEWADSRPGHGSQFHPHWFCPACGHSWQAKLYVKVDGQSGCPKCSTINRPWSRQPSLTQSQHNAMLEFDFERNRRAGLDPDKITAGSNKVVHWICTKCPNGQPHLFVASPKSRIGLNRGCPYCASKKACICNSLQSLYPALAAEYDTVRNDVGPEQVLPASHKQAFWKDPSGHTWEQSPFQRTEPSMKTVKRASIRSRHEQQACSDLL